MIKKDCKHPQVCHDCLREEIAQLEAKLAELKAKLPQSNVITIYQKPSYLPYPVITWPYTNFYSDGSSVQLCSGTTTNTLSA